MPVAMARPGHFAALRSTARRALPAPGRVRERRVQIALGALWLLDGLLQLQPVMFTRRFASGVLAPVAAGNPHLLAAPIRAAAQIVASHPVTLNALFAAIQIVLGVALILGRAPRAALAASLAWSLAVWWLGEGFGGVLGGRASPLSGAPGAVALYGLGALLAWPAPAGAATAGSVRRVGLFSAGLARLVVAAVWWLGAGLLLQPANLAPHALATEITGATSGEPRPLLTLVGPVAAAVGTHGRAVTLALAVAMALVALGLASGRAPRATLAAAVAVAVGIWLFGQDLGGILAGGATDPNSGPLLALVSLALAGAPALPAGTDPAPRAAPAGA